MQESDVPIAAPPEDKDPAELIVEAHKRRDELALRHQRRRINYTRFAVALGPVAVALLTLQALSFPQGGAWATVLIGLELVTLTLALGAGFLQAGKCHERWIEERLRAEVLRRELFLLHAGIGPYLNASDAGVRAKIRDRLLKLDNDLVEPSGNLPMRSEGRDWCDHVERWSGPAPIGDPAKFHACVRDYLEKRVTDQRKWFTNKTASHSWRAQFYESGAKIVLVAAVLLAAVHLGLLLAHGPASPGAVHRVLIFMALVAPAIGSALVGLQSVAGSHRLSRSYAYHGRALRHIEEEFNSLADEVGAPGRTAVDAALYTRFKLVALKTETVLTSDLLAWWLIVSPRATHG